MRPVLLAAGALAMLAVAACSKSDTSPRPAHSDVAAAMPDAATLAGAKGPATAAPHAPPRDVATLSDTHPVRPNSAPPAPPPGTNAQP
jgi:hypothetical protein